MASFSMESGWLYLITHLSDFQLMTFGSFLVTASTVILPSFAFMSVERVEWLQKYKIQSKTVSPEDKQKCIKGALLTLFGIIFPTMMFSYPSFKLMGMKTSLPLPPWYRVVFDIAAGLSLNEFLLYWAHVLLHTKWLYRHVHSVHHEYATPFGLTAAYAHPAEYIVLGTVNMIGFSLVTRPHLFTYWLWIAVQTSISVEAHCGYHFPWSPSNFLPFYGGAEFHDVHHQLSNTNYGFTFTFMDRFFGTDKRYAKKLKATLKAAAQIDEDSTYKKM